MASRTPTAIHYRLAATKVPAYVTATALLLLFLFWLVCLWYWRHSDLVIWWGVGFLLIYIWAAKSVWRWQQQLPTGWLVYNGIGWNVQGFSSNASARKTPVYKRCSCVLDLQSVLLLRLTGCNYRSPTPQVRWVWASSDASPEHWQMLRAVVYAQKSASVRI